MFKTGSVVAAIVLIVGFILCCASITVIEAGYAGVVYNTNGGVEPNVLSQGWHLVSPMKHVTEYPISTETVYLSKDTKEGSKDDESVNVGTSDGKPVNLDVAYTYRFDPVKLQHVFTKFRGQSSKVIADTYIRRIIKDNLSAISTQYGIFDVYGNKRAEVANKAYKMITESVIADGIVIEGFSITDVRPDEGTKAAIQNKVNAIQALEQIKVEKDKAVIEAEKKMIEANGEATKKKIEADAIAYSNQKVQSSATQQIIDLEWIKKWNGQLSQVSGGSAGLLVQAPNVK